MATWVLLQVTSPWQSTVGEPTTVRELTVASSRQLHFSNTEAATLSFSMPGNHRQTAGLEPLVSDILAFRTEGAVTEVVQRFRVVSRVLAKDNGVMSAQFSAVSYRALLDGWLLHGTDQRSFPGTGSVAVEQTLVAWTLLSTCQARSASSNLGITRGPVPTLSETRLLQPEGSFGATGGGAEEYFAEGMKLGEAITQLAEMDKGFEWDIVPDTRVGRDPYKDLAFMTWTVGDGGRTAPVPSDLLLNDGGSVVSWSHTTTPSEYANVLRVTGPEPTAFNVTGSTSAAIWQNGPTDTSIGESPTGNAALVPPEPHEGRWEAEGGSLDLQNDEAVGAAAATAWKKAHDYVPEISVSLARGRWTGLGQLWLGSMLRLLITEPVDDEPGEWILFIDEDVKVMEVDVTVDELGAEDVSLSLNRSKFNASTDARRVYDRLARIERR